MLVVNFFLQHALDLLDSQSAQLWLMRFKELDLRIMQWKLYLPPKWRDASVLNKDGIMDPNLTLAHITHNTAVILLHQSIAYTPSHWKNSSVHLPSAVSAETCIEAASEIAKIGHQFLHHSHILTNPQFSFCLFVAGRMLMAHSRSTKGPLPEHLDIIISSLVEISRRWAAPSAPEVDNLASVFAKRLTNARSKQNISSSRADMDIRRTVYSETSEKGQDDTQDNEQSTFDGQRDQDVMNHYQQGPDLQSGSASWDSTNPRVDTPSDTSPYSHSSVYNNLTLAFPPLPLSLEQDGLATAMNNHHHIISQMMISAEQQPTNTFMASGIDGNYRDWGNTVSDPYNGFVPPFQYQGNQVLDLAPTLDERISRYGESTIGGGNNRTAE